jgi:hypothetical protein
MTTLEAYCKANGWQGATIHGCKDHFAHLTLAHQDKICNYMLENMKDISDLKTMQYFLEQRNQHIAIIGLNRKAVI